MTTTFSPRLPVTPIRRRTSGHRVLGALTAAHRWWVEVLIAVGFYLAYEATRGLAPGRAAVAMSRGRALQHIEQLTHLAVEPLVAQALNGRHLLAVAAGYYYGTAHFAVTIAVLVWVYARRRAAYPHLRTTLLIISLAALVLFWAFPVAPPRLAVPNTVDTLSSLDVMGASHPRSLFNLANPYAAMPSLHMAWAVWCALAVGVGARRPWVRVLAWAYPLTTALVVLGTGNHYLLDVLAGLLLAIAAHQASRHLQPSVPAVTRQGPAARLLNASGPAGSRWAPATIGQRVGMPDEGDESDERNVACSAPGPKSPSTGR